MPITATCPSCSQMCQVEDQYAGMMVKCPKCGNMPFRRWLQLLRRPHSRAAPLGYSYSAPNGAYS